MKPGMRRLSRRAVCRPRRQFVRSWHANSLPHHYPRKSPCTIWKDSIRTSLSSLHAPGKGARHFFPTLNKSYCCMQAIQSIRIALVCLVRVTPRHLYDTPLITPVLPLRGALYRGEVWGAAQPLTCLSPPACQKRTVLPAGRSPPFPDLSPQSVGSSPSVTTHSGNAYRLNRRRIAKSTSAVCPARRNTAMYIQN
jgi:hypothetical protein